MTKVKKGARGGRRSGELGTRDAATGQFIPVRRKDLGPASGTGTVRRDVRTGEFLLGRASAPVTVTVPVKMPAASRPSDLLASLHETVAGLHAEGLVDKATMREFDEMCLAPVQMLDAHGIVTLRESVAVSQAVFAKYLNVSTSTVSKWEQGEKRPTSPALKLLDLVRRKGLQALA